MKKRILSIVTTLCMLLSMVPMMAVSAGAETNGVSYLYPVYNTDGDATSGIKEWKTGSVSSYNVVSSTGTQYWSGSQNGGWYVVDHSITISGHVSVSGNVKLILMDGCTLTVNADSYSAAIIVSTSSVESLAIYAQSAGDQMGALNANGGAEAAGIGGGVYVSGGNITINGGKITATNADYAGQCGAAIGGGYGSMGENITINGGTVIATSAAGYYAGAGIGGGYNGIAENITINGGTVTATCGYDGGVGGAGIGGGHSSSADGIYIYGGTVIANGGFASKGSGIGAGGDGSASNIYVAAYLNAVYGRNTGTATYNLPKTADNFASTLYEMKSFYSEYKSDSVVPGTMQNGTLTISNKKAVDGEKVTLTPTPSEGYKVSKVYRQVAGGSETEITDTGSGYSFTMSRSYPYVTVRATFEPITLQGSVKYTIQDGKWKDCKDKKISITLSNEKTYTDEKTLSERFPSISEEVSGLVTFYVNVTKIPYNVTFDSATLAD